MKNKLFLAACLALLSAPSLHAGLSAARAALRAPGKGVYEAELPPELHRASGSGGLDLGLYGEDGKARAFELGWAEGPQQGWLDLEPDTYELRDDHSLAWESALPRGYQLDELKVCVCREGFAGKMSVFALQGSDWKELARNRPIFSESLSLSLKSLPASRLRLVFSGMDERFRARATGIGRVSASGKSQPQGLLRRSIDLRAALADKGEGLYEISAALPGSRLFVEGLELELGRGFQGSWELGWAAVEGGRERFVQAASGSSGDLASQKNRLSLEAGLPWATEKLVLRLHSKTDPGAVAALRARLRLPRLVFFADKAGLYTAKAGEGNSAGLKSNGAEGKAHAGDLAFGPAAGAAGAAADLAKLYSSRGGPFKRSGYRWRSDVNASSAGFWRLLLSRQASLDENLGALRLVREGEQVPYFRGQGEERMEVLKFKDEYDKEKNQSSWVLELPQPSARWARLKLESQGRFRREIRLLKSRHGAAGWAEASKALWVSEGGQASLDFALGQAFAEDSQLRLEMSHGDNQAIEIDHITAYYPAVELLFLLDGPGPLELWGGNPKAAWPSYDLDLAQAQLLGSLPSEAAMGPMKPLKASIWSETLDIAFQERQGWLYGALFAVTGLLVFVIVRLFPSEGKPKPAKKKKAQRRN